MEKNTDEVIWCDEKCNFPVRLGKDYALSLYSHKFVSHSIQCVCVLVCDWISIREFLIQIPSLCSMIMASRRNRSEYTQYARTHTHTHQRARRRRRQTELHPTDTDAFSSAILTQSSWSQKWFDVRRLCKSSKIFSFSSRTDICISHPSHSSHWIHRGLGHNFIHIGRNNTFLSLMSYALISKFR